ncbi:rod shape-determining protein MreC [Phycicoccus sp. BSK3Z-2]|uniref:Cell shape-determining protein MreC n=1 Tax=Phycicoccus avicenniae TaxID=2828860 RepID=A0A941D9C4_9MICO|nr:rod shape-determining protein MreC [Phycicoccus avicenniae]MBR7744504.1 rod shape-determining protein MreC [Phycicoccus avicenniae]
MRRRAVLAAVVLTVLAVLLDVSGAVDLAPVRHVAAAALGPLERAVGPGADPAAERAARSAADAVLAPAVGDPEVAALLGSPGIDGARVVLARVVGVGPPGPSGPGRVTLGVGYRDGVEAGGTVLAADGLVGRVVDVARWTSDVELLGAPEVTVAVRVGERGVLGHAGAAAAPGASTPGPGELSLALVEQGTTHAGDAVVTLGSPGGRPFVPGVLVGTVTAVDDVAGRLAPTATVRPAVDPSTLDVVAVVVGGARTTPRPVVTGGPG